MIKKLFEIAGERKKKLIQGTILKVIESGFAGAPLIPSISRRSFSWLLDWLLAFSCKLYFIIGLMRSIIQPGFAS